mgnify:CR=1 FL=1
MQPERSHSYSTSINYDQPYEDFIIGFTLQAFYTRLNRAFYLQPVGEDEFGYLFEKQNGQGALVQGTTLELRMNYDRKVQLESGFTLQNNRFDTPVAYIEGLEGIRDFIRTPTDYGFALLSFTPNKKIKGSIKPSSVIPVISAESVDLHREEEAELLRQQEGKREEAESDEEGEDESEEEPGEEVAGPVSEGKDESEDKSEDGSEDGNADLEKIKRKTEEDNKEIMEGVKLSLIHI